MAGFALSAIQQLGVGGFFLEHDDARSGGFEPLRFVLPDKQVVLALVTTKHQRLDSEDDLKRRIPGRQIRPAGSVVSVRAMGLLLHSRGNGPTIDDEIAKLALIVESAAGVWGWSALHDRRVRSSTSSSIRTLWARANLANAARPDLMSRRVRSTMRLVAGIDSTVSWLPHRR
jgi:hypothetical protein